MPRFSLSWMFTLIALAALLLGLVGSAIQNRRSKSKISELNETIGDYRVMVEHRESDLSNSRMGLSLLAQLTLEPENKPLFSFLNTYEYGELSSYVEELPETNNAKLYVYHENRKRADGSFRTRESVKSAWLLVENSSNKILDLVQHTGAYHRSGSVPQILHLENIDGTETNYKILKTQFEPTP